jgi:predicted GNAT family acetyltransferase
LAINRDPDVEPDPWVRITAPSEIPLVLPACVAMFTHEVGYSPITEESTAYVGHVTSIVERGYSFSRFAGANSRSQSAVEFTAELGAVALDVAQVQGVWVAPHLRGTGLSAPALAAVVAHTRAHIARTLCLYANSHNVPALRTYARVGYERVGTFATVLF